MHPALSTLASHVVAAGQQTMPPSWSIPSRTLPVHDLIGVVSGHGTLQKIADATGWENASTFARTFKERTGQTPGTYRTLNAMVP